MSSKSPSPRTSAPTRGVRRLVAAVAALTVAAATAAAPVGSQVDPGGPAVPGVGDIVGAGVAAAVDDGPALVVVALDVPAADGGGGAAVAAIADAQDSVVDTLPADSVEGVVTFEHVPAMAIEVTDPRAIAALEAHPDVAKVDLDVGGTGSLAQTVPLTDTDERHLAGNLGDGIVVAVLDSGLDTDHPDLVNDVMLASQACFGFNGSGAGFGFCPDGSDSQTGSGAAEDDAGHGSHVAGIISSDGVVGAPGFAPGSELLALKITDNCNFSGCFYSFTLNVVAALDYIIANPQLGVDVINMSVGTGATFAGDCDNATSWTMAGAAAINTLRASGVIAFASAGNNFSSTNMTAPACLSNVIAVGASDDSDVAAVFTNVSTTTDIFGPGVGVLSSAIGGGTTSASGTSMASPSAAGCAALLIESGTATTPAAIEARLETSSTTVLAANGSTYPRFDCSPDLPRIRPFGVVATEGDTGTTTIQAQILLEDLAGNPFSAITPVTVNYATGDIPGNPLVAHPGSDFEATSGTVTFDPGESLATFPIDIIGDTVVEPPLLYGEWGLFTLNSPSSNAVIDTTTFLGIGLIIILDDD